MEKRFIRVQNCILGFGYASLVAYHKLLFKNEKNEILILKNDNLSNLFTLEHEGLRFSPLPIYPVLSSELHNSALFKNLPSAKPIAVSFSELKNFELKEFEVTEGSLANFMITRQGIDHNLCLGLKQWGPNMFTNSFSQVKSKIARHYLSSNGNIRIGFYESKSLYEHATNVLRPNVFGYQNIVNIDLEKKEINLKDVVIGFDKLISTIPLHHLIDLCGLTQDHSSAYAGALFYFFQYDSGLDENQMIYDCNFNSVISRIFSINDTFLMAQIGGDKFGKIDMADVKQSIRKLAPGIVNLKFAKELYLPMAYPLESIIGQKTLQSIEILKSNNIVPFGRFGNWEYADLHELDWSSIV